MAPICAVVGWLFKKQWNDIQDLRDEVSKLKITQAVSTNQIDSIKEDIRDLSQVVRDAEKNILDYLKK